MRLTDEEKEMLKGKQGYGLQKSMEILVALAEIYGANEMVPITSAQVAGVSYHNLGDAGLQYLEDLAETGVTARVTATLNPAGMDLLDFRSLGIDERFAEKQKMVIKAYRKMGITPECTCTPYLAGNTPRQGDHVAWSESSAVAYANSILGARTNREGGPSALASALTGRTPMYGLHLDGERMAQILVEVGADLKFSSDFGALGCAVGRSTVGCIPFVRGVREWSLDHAKNFSASIATYGGHGLFHLEGVTPNRTSIPRDSITVTQGDVAAVYDALNDDEKNVDFVALGCPHASLEELKLIVELLKGRRVKAELWISVSRKVRLQADTLGYSDVILVSGAKYACDTCMAVAPLRGRFKVMATDSAKACYYGRGSNRFKTRFGSLEKCVEAAVTGQWSL